MVGPLVLRAVAVVVGVACRYYTGVRLVRVTEAPSSF